MQLVVYYVVDLWVMGLNATIACIGQILLHFVYLQVNGCSLWPDVCIAPIRSHVSAEDGQVDRTKLEGDIYDEYGATAEGLPPLTHGLVSKGAIELVHHFYDSANRELANKLANEVKEVELGHIE
ncbi:hypothetical protein LSH36_362g02067 [Paralvinella palmiformis]|uniref:Uncharacterized protein n=1 Tax=Paralvinella palmiformis TaxID=53620 RepID=A0AAD9MZE7_9ANNE|nr:hypothetical protein LSH36_362g02067 [Paralvinella palmiformis]